MKFIHNEKNKNCKCFACQWKQMKKHDQLDKNCNCFTCQWQETIAEINKTL